MQSKYLKASLKTISLGIIVLLCIAAASAQVTVNLTAAQQSTTLPDGNTVPMWGWSCGQVTNTVTTGPQASCLALNGAVQSGPTVWQPPLITVPTGQSLTINLTNSLPMETSLTIVGQLGGGLGSPVRELGGPRTDGAHAGQTSTTWPIQGSGNFTPPGQATRARSFVPEVAPGATTPPISPYSWAAYNATTGQGLRPGTYLIETGTYPSIQAPMGLYGVLVVTAAPTPAATNTAFAPGTAYSGSALTATPSTTKPYSIQYDADVPLLLSEIDPVQNAAVVTAVNTPGFSETLKWSGAATACGDPTVHTCLPPAVNYTPLYFLLNGVSLDRTATASSAVPVPGSASTGNVLLRFVNAGLRMHVPSVDGLKMSLIAEDGNVLQDVALAGANGKPLSARVQNEVFLAAGKVYDAIVNPKNSTGTYAASQFVVFDRQLSLSGNGFRHDTGMQAIVIVNGGANGNGTVSGGLTAQAVNDNYIVPVGATTFSANVLNNDIGIASATLANPPSHGTVVVNSNGSFTYTATAAGVADSFTYCGNIATAGACPTLVSGAGGNSNFFATVTLNAATIGTAPVAKADTYTSNVSALIKVNAPGVLANDTDQDGYPLTVPTVLDLVPTGLSVTMNPDGGFTAAPSTTTGGSYFFCYHAVNSQGTRSTAFGNPTGSTCPTNTTQVSLTFQAGSGLKVTVQDAQNGALIGDYKWVIEQDLTFHVDPACQQNGSGGSKPSYCSTAVPPTLGTNFHTSYMPVVAAGCTGDQSCGRAQTVYDPGSKTHVSAVCDGSGICHPAASSVQPLSTPDQVNLPATDQFGRPAYYFISILPGDVANPFNTANAKDPTVAANCDTSGTAKTPTGQTVASTCGHTMGGAPIAPSQAAVTVKVEPNPLPTATLTVLVFEDDFPLNGEPDTGGGVDLATQEVPLGDFQIELWDAAGGSGDATGQMTYDMFNEPLTNALNGTIDPKTGLNACPIANTAAADPTNNAPRVATGTIIVCPQFESDGVTPSPLTGQAAIKNLMPGRFGVIVHPGQTREANGEEWLQTNTLDGTHFLDAFVKAGEPAYFQEFGPGGYHVFMGMANPVIINSRRETLCNGPAAPKCNNTVKGQVASLHQSRSPNEALYDSAVYPQGNATNYAALNYTNCYVSLGDPDGETIALTKCDANGNFTFTGIPDGNWGIVVFDQWMDLIVDGSSKAVNVAGGQTVNVDYSAFTWQAHVWNKTFLDVNGNGIQDDPKTEPGILQVPSRIRMRNGKYNNFSATDINGMAAFNETFPLFNWYVVESDTTRFKGTGVHVVNDAGGQLDGPASGCFGATVNGSSGTCGNGNLGPYQGVLNSKEIFPLPNNLRVPGAYYCQNGDCSERAGTAGTPPAGGPGGSTGRIDPGSTITEGWQGGLGEFDILEWGKLPYEVGENGGIRGHVVYDSTRPFDDPGQLFQNVWEPLVPGVTVNLYQEGTASDGTQSLTLIDTTLTSSWDKWAQGFRADGLTSNMNCPGQDPADPFFNYTEAGTPNYLNPSKPLLNNSQYKCYDGYHNLNQVQPAPYDGMYQFPSPACSTPAATFTTTINGTQQMIQCVTKSNSHAGDPGSSPVVLPPGKYVVEVVVPPGYELVKEEDKNILIGDNFIAPVTQQFGGIGGIFIVPDQATVNNTNQSYGSGGGSTNPTTDLGRTFNIGGFGPAGLIIVMPAPCVGALRIVPDFMSISPESGEVAPFAGASRNLCDRKELVVEDQMQAQADFFIWTKTPAASHFTGFITDDFSSEFDPASPAFGEKFAVPNVPVSIRDFNGVEVSRIYSDQWGTFNGLTFSTFDVDPPNPTGYAPGMMLTCMNDPGPIPDPSHPGQMITDPYYNSNYSNFCYENPFMPADTDYLDTPVVPTAAFAEGYNPPDCAYPDATPAIASVIGNDTTGAVGGSSGQGPWVSGAGPGHTLTINALGDQLVPNHAFSGPAATGAPYNQKFITRHYGFGPPPSTCPSAGPCPNVTVGGAPLTDVTWLPGQITGTVPTGVPNCARQQQGQPTAQCGELVITAANGQQSIDTVTVTVGGKAPTVVAGGQTIQSTIDSAAPGDLIIVPASTYSEMLLMWKPVRLQGVGAASSVVNANTHPAGKLLDPWRRKVNCLFGLALNGGFVDNTVNATTGKPNNPYDPSGTYSASCNFYNSVPGQVTTQSQVDPLPLEPVVGWDATLNGNLAEQLQEPSLMGAYEGAAITLLAKGLENNNTTTCDPTNSAGCKPLNDNTAAGGDCNVSSPFYTSNFLCNPARIDGMGFINSSQGGGGIFLHGWGHYTEVANNRIHSNAGTLTGGITVGLMETPDPTVIGGTNNAIAQPLLLDHHVYVHHNSVTQNTSYGDELNSTTPASAGGVTFCTGSDYYSFQYNWVCGNLSSGDGGGMSHNGFSWNGDIEHNWFLFNQSSNPTITTHGGGLIVQGAAPDGTVCENSLVDLDCPPQLSDGVGPGLVINANLFQGNTSESGSGGGLRLQSVNGNDILNNPGNPANWHRVGISNNIFVDNVAGWAGGGVSMQDAVWVDFINNTVASNDTTASAGVLFDTLGAPNANVPPPGCTPTTGAGCSKPVTNSNFQPSGLEVEKHSVNLTPAFTVPNVTCPAGHPNCTKFSNPLLYNDLFWQNRAFHICIGCNPVTGVHNVVSLVPQLSQNTTGQCPTSGFTPPGGSQGPGPNYWDIGVYGDSTSTPNSGSGYALNPLYSMLTSTTGYSSTDIAGDPTFVKQYCNGSRVPPEVAPQVCTSTANAPGCNPGSNTGSTVPQGVPDINPFYPLFTLNPAATVDEGNNWINMFYGPLSLSNATAYTSGGTVIPPLGNYAPSSAGSPAVDAIPPSAPTYAVSPIKDFFGNKRPEGTRGVDSIDIGAIEFQGPPAAPNASVSPTSLTFTSQAVGTGSPAPGQVVTVSNTGTGSLTITVGGTGSANFGTTSEFRRGAAAGGTNPPNCGTTVAPGASCSITVRFFPSGTGTRSGTLAITTNDPAHQTLTVTLSGTGITLPPNASVSPASFDFGNVRIPIPIFGGPTHDFILSNAAGAGTLSNINIAVSPTPFFRVNSGVSNNCGTSLAGGASCTIRVIFLPSTNAVYNGTVAITSTNGVVTNAPATLRGTAFEIVLTWTGKPGNLTFNYSTTANRTATVTVQNWGSGAITLSSVTFTGTNNTNFTRSATPNQGTCGASLAAAVLVGVTPTTCTINVLFTAATTGTYTATMNLNDNDSVQPQLVPLVGTR